MQKPSILSDINVFCLTALPLMAAFLAQKGIQTIDSVMMGWIGPQALAAGALSMASMMLMMIFCMGTLSSIGIFTARAKGSQAHDDIPLIIQCGILLVAVFSIPVMVILWCLPTLFLHLHQNPVVVANAALLLHSIVWGVPGFLFFYVFRELLSAFAMAQVVMLVCLIAMPLTFFANYVLIYGLFGLPALGISGIGYASGGVMWMMFLCLLLYCKKHPSIKHHLNFSTWKVSTTTHTHKLMEMIRVGLPSGLIGVLDVGMFTFAALMIGSFGVDPLAGHQIAMQCASLAYNVPFALSMTTALQVSHAVGGKNYSLAKYNAYLGLAIGLCLTIAIAFFFIFTPDWLIKPFLDDQLASHQEVTKLAISFLFIAGLFQTFDALQAIMNGVLRGYKDTFIPMLICLFSYWVIGVCFAYYFAFHTAIGPVGVWYGLTIGIIFAGSSLALRFAWVSKKGYALPHLQQ